MPGDDLVFPAGAARTSSSNDFPAGTSFRSIRFTGDAAAYVLSGNLVVLGAGGITMAVVDSPDTATLALPIRLGIAQTFAIQTAGGGTGQITYSGGIDLAGRTLTLSSSTSASSTHRVTGPLSGSGNLNISGGMCQVILAGPNTSTGMTTLNGCTTYVNTDYSARDFNVGAYSRLQGQGTVGKVTALAVQSDLSAATDTAPASILTVSKDLAMRKYSNLAVTLKGPGAGSGYGQVVAKGAVSLASGLVLDSDFHPTFGQAFTIVSNQGSGTVTGTFAGLPEGAVVGPTVAGATYRITYKGGASARDVVLTALSTGTTRTWSGLGADRNWTTPANWQGNMAPKAGDSLVFASSTPWSTALNDYASGTTFNGLTFPADTSFTPNTFALSGNQITLATSGVRVPGVGAGSNVTVSLPIRLATQLTFNVDFPNGLTTNGDVDLAGHDLVLYGNDQLFGGVLEGAGRVVQNANGVVSLAGSAATSGAILVNGGVLSVNGDYHLRSVTVDDVVPPVLVGSGSIGPLTVARGVVRLYDPLTVKGKVSFASTTTYEPRLSSDPRANYGQLSVTGPVDLGGAALTVHTDSPPTSGHVSTIVSNKGASAVVGTFAGLPEGYRVADADDPSVGYWISYKGGASGRDVTLTAIGNTLLPSADLAVSQTASPDPVAQGDKARFTVRVENGGQADAVATVRGKVPEGASLVGLNGLAGWTCRTGTGAASRGYACTRTAALAMGRSDSFVLVVRADGDAGPSLINQVTVSGDVDDPNPSNNTSVASVTVS